MPAKVVDASVVAAWCYGEPRASYALGLLQDSDLYAPLLLAYELASIARRKATAYPERTEAFSEALATALALPIHWSDVDHLAVVSLALEADLTTYDASYLYLARALGVPLATFDQQLLRATQQK
jgi:predicted nucleic acid-binding protein